MKDILREIEESSSEIVMSQQKASRTQVVKIKGVSFNYVQFLWSKIGMVYQLQSKQAYAEAMRLVTDLIHYLPESIKEEFRNRAVQIDYTLTLIKGNRLKCIKAIPDLFIRGIYRNRLLQSYSDSALTEFVDNLSSRLQQLGYMENVEKVEQGEDDWYGEQRKQKAQKERERKRSEASKFEAVEGV